MAAGPDEITLNAFISVCGASQQWQRSISALLGRVPGLTGLEPGTVTCNAALAACQTQWRQCASILKVAAAAHISIDEVGYSAAISAFDRGHSWQRASLTLQQMQKEVGPNVVAANSVLAAFEKVGIWNFSLALLRHSRSEQVEADLVSFNSAASCCEKSMLWSKAMHVFEDTRITYDLISFNVLLRACMHAADWQSAGALLARMQEESLQPTEMSLAPAIEALAT